MIILSWKRVKIVFTDQKCMELDTISVVFESRLKMFLNNLVSNVLQPKIINVFCDILFYSTIFLSPRYLLKMKIITERGAPSSPMWARPCNVYKFIYNVIMYIIITLNERFACHQACCYKTYKYNIITRS